MENLGTSTLIGFVGHAHRRFEVLRQQDGRVLLHVRDRGRAISESLLSFDRIMLNELIALLHDSKGETSSAHQARVGTPSSGVLTLDDAGKRCAGNRVRRGLSGQPDDLRDDNRERRP